MVWQVSYHCTFWLLSPVLSGVCSLEGWQRTGNSGHWSKPALLQVYYPRFKYISNRETLLCWGAKFQQTSRKFMTNWILKYMCNYGTVICVVDLVSVTLTVQTNTSIWGPYVGWEECCRLSSSPSQTQPSAVIGRLAPGTVMRSGWQPMLNQLFSQSSHLTS